VFAAILWSAFRGFRVIGTARCRLTDMQTRQRGGVVRQNRGQVSAVQTGGGRPWTGHTDPVALRDAWNRAALADGWTRPSDWWTVEVDAVTESLVGGGDTLATVAELGRARADAGVGVREALDDLCALYRELPAGTPSLAVLRALVEAWAEASVASIHAATCEDPVSGLVTMAYLRTRCAELYRQAEADGAPAGEGVALLILDIAGLADATGWESLLFRLALGDCLRSVFSGGETLAAAGTTTVLGLVGRNRRLPHRVAALRKRLAEVAGLTGVRAWTEALPPTLPGAYQLLETADRLM
jgi:hypothetical protein